MACADVSAKPAEKPCCGCGAPCPFDYEPGDVNYEPDKPCWGQVHAVDNDFQEDPETGEWDGSYLHACEGHSNYYFAGSKYDSSYVPQPVKPGGK